MKSKKKDVIRKAEQKRCIEQVNLAIDEFGSLCGETDIVKDYIKQVIKNRILATEDVDTTTEDSEGT